MIKERVIPEIRKRKIENIKMMYSLGEDGLKNEKKENHINEIIKIIDNEFISEKIVMKHDVSIQCLKLIRTLENENGELFNKMKDFNNSIKNKKLFKKNKSSIFINNSKTFFKEGIFTENNLMFTINRNIVELFGKKFNFLII